MPAGLNFVRGAALAAVGLQPEPGVVLSADRSLAASDRVTGGSFPKSIQVPGTETSINTYGQITEVIDYWLSGVTPCQPAIDRSRRERPGAGDPAAQHHGSRT